MSRGEGGAGADDGPREACGKTQVAVDGHARERAGGAGEVEGLAVCEADAPAVDSAADKIPRASVGIERQIVAGVIDRAVDVHGAAGVDEVPNAAGGVEGAA